MKYQLSANFSLRSPAIVLHVAALLLSLTPSLLAQDDSALSAMVAMEKVIVNSIEQSEKSVVAIARVRKGSIGDPTDPNFVPNEFGTGVVIDAAGLILTNYHVLGRIEENDYYVWIQHRPFQVTKVMKADSVKAADPWTDLAVLQIDARDLQPIKFGDASKLRKGQIVISLGNPYAIARDGEPSASWGIISNLSRKATLNPSDLDAERNAKSIHHYGTLIQTDAKLNLGTSGGALLNLQGEMIGLTTSLAAMQQYESSAGFAIPVDDTFKRVVNALKKGDQPEFGFLGIAPSDIAARARRQGSFGVRIERVVDGSPAAFAKLLPGDFITEIDHQPVRDTSELMRDLGSRAVDSEVQLTVLRSDLRPLQIPVKLSKKPVLFDLPTYSQNQPQSWRGMQVEYTTAIRDFPLVSHLVDEKGCVVITSVERDSAAWQAGLRPRLFVSHVNGKRVSNPREFFTAVEKLNEAVTLQLTRPQGDDGTMITVQPSADASNPQAD